MTDETLFAAALEQADPAAYLAAHCPDPAVRRRVAELLAAHAAAGSFLDHPAVGADVTTTLPPADPGATRTQASTDPDATADPRAGAANPDDALAFLKPPTRRGSLGRLAHYEVLEVLGSGGFGTVLKAFDDRLHRVVAVKVLAPQLAASGAARARFVREARTAAAVRDEHVVNVFAVSDDDAPVPFLVMELVAGQTLQAKLDKVGPLPAKEVLRVGSQIARGLAAAHKQGLVHRDIKPTNILLENGVERVKVTDFGLARAADDASISQSGVVAGTPMYMSPEQARGDTLDTRSDLFSLGSVLYVLCTGRPPFRAETTLAVLKRVVEDDPRPVRDVNPEVPRWLADVVAKLHAKSPADRFQTAAEVADLLSGYLAELQQQGTVVSRVAPPPKPPRRKSPRWAWAAVGCLLLVGVPAGLLGLALGLPAWQRSQPRVEAPPSAVVSLRLSDTAIQFRFDDVGPPQTGLAVGQFPFAPGEHSVWFKLGGREFRTANFTLTPGERADLELAVTAAGGTATLNGVGLVVTGGSGAATRVAWGEVVDPLGDCRVSEDARGLTLAVPPGNHDLSTVPGANMNGPRVLRDAAGDFEARVVVPPLPKPKAGTSGRGDGVSYVGAGLVVWSGDRLVLRLFRAGLATNNDGTPFAQVEWFPPGTSRGHEAKYVPDGPVHLRLRRAGGTLHPAFSSDGKAWTDLPPVTDVPLAAGLRVGVGAVSTYHQEVAFRLDRPTLVVAAPPPAAPPPPAVAPFAAAEAKAHQEAWAAHLGVKVEFKNDNGMTMRLVPPGKNVLANAKLLPVPAEAARPLYAGAHEVTVGQFKRFVAATGHKTAPEGGTGGFLVRDKDAGAPGGPPRRPDLAWNHPAVGPSDDHPVAMVSYFDAKAFCDWLTRTEGRTYRLPTEEEWRWLAAAGAREFYFAAGGGTLGDHAWVKDNSESHTHPVGRKGANPWGLYDVYGNVVELSAGWIAADRQSRAPVPAGPDQVTTQAQIVNGGSYRDTPPHGRSFGFQALDSPCSHVGFRVVAEALPAATPPAATHALSFDGVDDYVEVPTLKYDGTHPITLEAWVRVPRAPDRVMHVVSNDGGVALGLNERGQWNAGVRDQPGVSAKSHRYIWSADPAEPGKLTHVAVVLFGTEGRLFVDGKRQATKAAQRGDHVPTAASFFVGARRVPRDQWSYPLHGEVAAVRVSKVARYDRDFTPPAGRFDADELTTALYHFAEGKGDVLTDSSGNNHHGKIVGATWVPAPAAAIPQPRRDLIAAREKELAAVKARLDAGLVTRAELAEAEVGVFEARLDGAPAPDAVRLLGLIIDRHETRRAVAAARVKGGVLAAADLHPIDADVARAKVRLADVRVPVPRRAADILPFWVGTWRTASEVVVPAPAAGPGRGGGTVVLDLVGDGKYLRGVGTEDAHPFQTLLVQTHDEPKDALRGWFYMSDGKASGPAPGVWDADARTLLWMEKLPDGLQSVHRFEFVDADTVKARLFHQNDKNEIVFELRNTFTRQKAAAVPRDLPAAADRPPERAALDRLVGEWVNETTLKTLAPDAKDRKVTTIERGRPVLGGRLVEVTHTGGPSGTNDYWLAGYDPAAKLHRVWFFGADGGTAEFAGVWDAAAAAMRLSAAGGSAAGSWAFPTADRREGRFTIRDPAGKVVAEMTSASRRVGTGGKD